jgi:hypothetical protein
VAEDTLQIWSLTATTAGVALQAGQAEVCGLAMTFEDSSVTDTYEWCRLDVSLAWPIYLPLFLNQP